MFDCLTVLYNFWTHHPIPIEVNPIILAYEKKYIIAKSLLSKHYKIGLLLKNQSANQPPSSFTRKYLSSYSPSAVTRGRASSYKWTGRWFESIEWWSSQPVGSKVRQGASSKVRPKIRVGERIASCKLISRDQMIKVHHPKKFSLRSYNK